MAQAVLNQAKREPGDGIAAAWRGLWGARDGDALPDVHRDRAPWRSGVTYRGYLGASGGVSASWTSEQQLKDMHALLRVAAAAGRLGAWEVEMAGQHVVWSDEVKAIHEVAPDYEPTFEEALAFFHPWSQGQMAQAFDACAARGIAFDLELQLVTAKGNELWIRTIGAAECDAQGKITRVRGAIQDVSRSRAAVDEARLTAERFTRTLESLSDGFMLLDHEWRFVYVNAEAERILRRGRAELHGRNMLLEFPETVSGKFIERCQDARRTGKSIEFEKYYAPLGIWVHMKVSASDLGLTVCIRDDTERITTRRQLLRLQAELVGLRGPR
jgi:PAS domain S-box-containing protein